MRSIYPALFGLSLLTLACAPVQPADTRFPILDSVGFDWLHPETARCERITASRAENFEQCDFHETGAFGVPLAHHVCKASKGREFLLFASDADCQEALETMQANAP